ncbi:MAG: AI-2E family transporter [Kineosporiaceae bacterium]
MTDPVVPADVPPRPDPVTSERVEVARGSGGRPVLLPRGVVVATAWSWRFLVVGAALYVLLFLVLARTTVVTTPLLLAVLVTALLYPLFRVLRRLRLPTIVAALLAILVLLLVVSAALYFVGQQIASGIREATDQAALGLNQLLERTAQVFGVDESRITDLAGQAQEQLQSASSQLASGALSVTSTVATVLTGLLLALFATIFFLADGPRIWRFLTRLLPSEAREPAFHAGQEAWHSVGAYVRTIPVVALADAVAIGGGAWLLGIPFALPIGVLTFFAAFVPIVGAVVAGALAVLIALVSNGLVTALVMLAIILAVQQLEGNVLQPVLLGRALDLHPLAVVLATSIGILLAGIVGGVLAVPVLAAAIVAVASLRRGDAERHRRARAVVHGASPAGADGEGRPPA